MLKQDLKNYWNMNLNEIRKLIRTEIEHVIYESQIQPQVQTQTQTQVQGQVKPQLDATGFEKKDDSGAGVAPQGASSLGGQSQKPAQTATSLGGQSQQVAQSSSSLGGQSQLSQGVTDTSAETKLTEQNTEEQDAAAAAAANPMSSDVDKMIKSINVDITNIKAMTDRKLKEKRYINDPSPTVVAAKKVSIDQELKMYKAQLDKKNNDLKNAQELKTQATQAEANAKAMAAASANKPTNPVAPSAPVPGTEQTSASASFTSTVGGA
jgi:hypothetical protein